MTQPPQPSLKANQNVRVIVRIRPLLSSEKGHTTNILNIGDDKRTVEICLDQDSEIPSNKKGMRKRFQFDHVFDQTTSQEELFEKANIPSMAEAVLEGYNATVFAYGQTGSGKTFTLEGYDYGTSSSSSSSSSTPSFGPGGRVRVRPRPNIKDTPSTRLGVVPRITQALFEMAEKYNKGGSSSSTGGGGGGGGGFQCIQQRHPGGGGGGGQGEGGGANQGVFCSNL